MPGRGSKAGWPLSDSVSSRPGVIRAFLLFHPAGPGADTTGTESGPACVVAHSGQRPRVS